MIQRLVLLGALMLVASFSYGQKIILDELSQMKVGDGEVVVYQDSRLEAMMREQKRNAKMHLVEEQGVPYIVGRGYRIQILSSNDQREAKAEAYAKRDELFEAFPNIPTYITFQSPFWKLRAGNYRTMEEAHAGVRQIKQLFPTWKEMFIIRDVIKLPVYDINAQIASSDSLTIGTPSNYYP